jgi:hypothetical protein
MVKFSSITLDGGTVRVAGPITGDEGRCMRRVNFFLVQPGVVVEGDGEASGTSGWSGAADAGGLQPGPVTAVGVSVFIDLQLEPISVETRTWSEAREIAAK